MIWFDASHRPKVDQSYARWEIAMQNELAHMNKNNVKTFQ